MERWKGCVALVTGASSGIGEDIARKLVSHGLKKEVILKVIGCARRHGKLDEIRMSLGDVPGSFHPFRCDVTNEDEVLAMFKHIKENFNRLDIFINNAGTVRPAPLLSGETRMWQEMLDLNVLSLCVGVREAVKTMKATEAKNGHVVLVSSSCGHSLSKLGDPNTHFYCATKFAVNALTEGLRKELRKEKSNIRISEISPGIVRTDIHAMYTSDDVIHKILVEKKPLETEDTSNAILYLLSAPPHVQVHDIIVKAVEFN